MCGHYPEADNEICISTYYAQGIMEGTYKDYHIEEGMTGIIPYDVIEFDSMEDILGWYLMFNPTNLYTFTICGIIDVGDIASDFDRVSSTSGSDTASKNYSNYLKNGIHTSIFTTAGFIESYTSDSNLSEYTYGEMFDAVLGTYYITPYDSISEDKWYTDIGYFRNYDGTRLNKYTYFLDGTDALDHTSLEDDELILPLSMIRCMLNNMEYSTPTKPDHDAIPVASAGSSEDSSGGIAEGCGGFAACADSVPAASTASLSTASAAPLVTTSGNYTDEELADFTEKAIALESGGYTYYTDEGYMSFHYLTTDERAEYGAAICDFLSKADLTLSIYEDTGYSETGSGTELVGTFKIAAYYIAYVYYDMGIYCSENVFSSFGMEEYTVVKDPYTCPDDAIYSYMVIPLQHSESWLKNIFKGLDKPAWGTTVYYTSDNAVYANVLEVGDVISSVSVIFLVVGIVFAVFAALLLLNFISVSISNKNKEIGILRAVGAKGTDVFKIFFSESAIIAIICFILSIIITAVAANYINNILLSSYSVYVSMVVFGPWSVLMLLAIAVVVAFLGTFFPVYSASKKKPADSIRSL